MAPDPPDASDPRVLHRLKEALRANGYSATNLEGLVTSDALDAYVDGWYKPARRQTEPVTALSTLTLMFALGFEVPAKDLDAIPGASASDWVDAGLVAIRRNVAHPLALIQPLLLAGAELILVSDAPELGLGRPPFRDWVMGATASSARLAKMTLRRRVSSALDVGTGSGLLAILAARHCEQVVATDVTKRALAFARFNLAMNGAENVELRLGDRYEPVQGELFDLIVCNPPFVVSPATTLQYRDSGLPTDTISETTVRGAAEHLASDGWAQIMCQWVHLDGERWQDRVGSWVAGSGCNAWAVQRSAMGPVEYATEWLRELGKANPEEADRQFEQWMSYYDEHGVIGVGSGFVVLRKTDSQPNWFRADEVSLTLGDDSGEAIASLFETQDWLEQHPEPDALLDSRLRLVDQTGLHTTSAASAARWEASERSLQQTAGLGISAENIHPDVAEIVARCDGSRTLRTLAMEIFQGRWRDPARRTVEIEGPIRQLVSAGFMVPVTESP